MIFLIHLTTFICQSEIIINDNPMKIISKIQIKREKNNNHIDYFKLMNKQN